MTGRKRWDCWIDCQVFAGVGAVGYEEPLRSLNMEEHKDRDISGKIISQQPVCVLSHSVVPFSATPWTVAPQVSLCMGLSKQEYWSGLPCPPPGDLPNPGNEPRSSTLQVILYYLSHHIDPGGTEDSQEAFKVIKEWIMVVRNGVRNQEGKK